MTGELERQDTVTGQVPLPGMPDDGVLFHVEPTPPRRVNPNVVTRTPRVSTVRSDAQREA